MSSAIGLICLATAMMGVVEEPARMVRPIVEVCAGREQRHSMDTRIVGPDADRQ